MGHRGEGLGSAGGDGDVLRRLGGHGLLDRRVRRHGGDGGGVRLGRRHLLPGSRCRYGLGALTRILTRVRDGGRYGVRGGTGCVPGAPGQPGGRTDGRTRFRARTRLGSGRLGRRYGRALGPRKALRTRSPLRTRRGNGVRDRCARGALPVRRGRGGLRRVLRLTGARLRRDAGDQRLGGPQGPLRRNNRFRLGGRTHRRMGAPGMRRLRDRFPGARHVEVLGAGGRQACLAHRHVGGAAVGKGADRAGGGAGNGRAEVQRPARRGRRLRPVRDRGTGRLLLPGIGQADATEVDRPGVPAGRLVRSRLVHGLDDRLRRGWGDLVARGALGARQQQVFVLGGTLER
ncbi:hypothetical protein SHIRM173S_10787 [Streptomyces hirsutus]